MKNLCCILLFTLIGLTKIVFVSGEPGDWKFPAFNASEDAFFKFSEPLDDERAKKLKALGYNEKFRVISFESICKGLGKSSCDFAADIKNYEKILTDLVRLLPCSFRILSKDGCYDVSSLLLSDFFED